MESKRNQSNYQTAEQTELTIGNLACLLIDGSQPQLVYFSPTEDMQVPEAISEMTHADNLANLPRRVRTAGSTSPIAKALAKNGDKTIGDQADFVQHHAQILGIWPEESLEEAVSVTSFVKKILASKH
ncbi:MAG: hypothetical protein LBU20_00805 [Candidatus Nomurabacteria bacterium]|jgi:hypothetical protein|nr:hypothetical protein [Candidatus Nomurabacteria bacterium]